MRYRDRVHAGRELACELAGRSAGDAVVLAVSDNGSIVAGAVARSLGAPLEVLRPDEVGSPGSVLARIVDRTVVLVDDGMTTGSTMVAACDLVREAGARRVVVGVPVAAVDAVGRARTVADEVVVLQVECDVARIADWYEVPTPLDGHHLDGQHLDGHQGANGADPGARGQGPGVLLQAG